MAIVRRKTTSGDTVFWITFSYLGKTVWERSGKVEREAKRLEAQRKAEVKAGTYDPNFDKRPTVGAYLAHYMSKRTNRSADNERNLVRDHVEPVEAFCKMRLADVRGKHMLRLVEIMRAAGRLGEKSIATVYTIVAGAMRRAVFEELLSVDPTKLPKGSIKWKSRKKRQPYTREEVKAVLTCPAVPVDTRMWCALAWFTGMREGEVCGRRWRDYDTQAQPLGALKVHTQYDDRPLKSDDDEDVRPRLVPVHPELEAMLRAWWTSGFELVHRRPPTLDDFIVPNRQGGNHTKSSAYKAFQKALKVAGVVNKTLHATRNTFISLTRSNGARKDVVERVTHNASGDVVETYTQFEWKPLCEAVACFDLSLDQNANGLDFLAPKPGLEAGGETGNSAESGVTSDDEEPDPEGQKPAETGGGEVTLGASQKAFPPAAWALAMAAERALSLYRSKPHQVLVVRKRGRGVA